MSILVGLIWVLIAVAVAVVVTAVGTVIAKHIRKYIEKHRDEVASKTRLGVVAVCAVLVLVLMLLIPGAVRGEEAEKLSWLPVRVNGSVKVIYMGKPAWLVVTTSNEGEIITYFDTKELYEDQWIYVHINTDYEVKGVSYNDPTNIIWAPIGGVLVVAQEKKRRKIKLCQRLVPDFFMTVKKFEQGTPGEFAIDLASTKVYVFVCLDDGTKALFILPSLEKAMSEVDRIDKPAFVTCFVPKYEHQAVVYCNYKGHLEFWRGTAQSDKIRAALQDLQIVGARKDVEDVQVVTSMEKNIEKLQNEIKLLSCGSKHEDF